MAADVDKTTPEDGHRARGSGSWVFRGMWTLLFVAAVPLLAFGIKYYQDTQFLKRHVSFNIFNDINTRLIHRREILTWSAFSLNLKRNEVCS